MSASIAHEGGAAVPTFVLDRAVELDDDAAGQYELDARDATRWQPDARLLLRRDAECAQHQPGERLGMRRADRLRGRIRQARVPV